MRVRSPGPSDLTRQFIQAPHASPLSMTGYIAENQQQSAPSSALSANIRLFSLAMPTAED
jgi:hypothetical protein